MVAGWVRLCLPRARASCKSRKQVCLLERRLPSIEETANQERAGDAAEPKMDVPRNRADGGRRRTGRGLGDWRARQHDGQRRCAEPLSRGRQIRQTTEDVRGGHTALAISDLRRYVELSDSRWQLPRPQARLESAMDSAAEFRVGAQVQAAGTRRAGQPDESREDLLSRA